MNLRPGSRCQGSSVAVVVAVLLGMVAPRLATAQQTFNAGAVIIPMDIDYQDNGMLRAFGLLYALLKGGVPVHWVIKSPKNLGDVDFTTVSKDFKTGADLASHGYRGGPFVVEQSNVAKATPIITAWQAANATTTVHVSQQAFVARSGRYLTAAPTIAIIADGHEDIAFSYLNAAGIPDRLGNSWTASSPDLLSVAAIEGPTKSNHCDGALFRPSGQPNYCQIMTMHWDVKQVWGVHDEAVAEYRCFLGFPVHMFAECQAVNAVENDVYGKFITTTGFVIDNNVKSTGPFSFLNMDTPFAQMDGPFNLVGGSEIAYSLPAGGAFYDKNVVMIKDAATSLGQRSIWMTGYLNGACTVDEGSDTGPACSAGVGKVSYLGGHQYAVKVPISKNPTTQGTRLFLNSLFEAGCVTSEGQPVIKLTKSGPHWTTSPTVTYTLSWVNSGPGPALDFTVSDTLPLGASYVSSTGGGVLSGSQVTWKLGDLTASGVGSVQLTVSLSSYGAYTNSFGATFTVGLNTKTATSNSVTTVYQGNPPPPDSGSAKDAGPAKDAGSANIDGGGAKDTPYGADAKNVLDGPGCIAAGGSCTKSASCCSTLCFAGTCIDTPPWPEAGVADQSQAGDSPSPADATGPLADAASPVGDAAKSADASMAGDKQSVAVADVAETSSEATGHGTDRAKLGEGPSGAEPQAGGDRPSWPGSREGAGTTSGAPSGCQCEAGRAPGGRPNMILVSAVSMVLLVVCRRRRRHRHRHR